MFRTLFLLLTTCCLGYAQQCDANTPFTVYQPTPPSPYNGVVSLSTANCNSNLVCGSSTVLADSITTPTETLDLNDPAYLRNFATWNSSVSNLNVVFQFLHAVQLSRVDLYFLHYPEMNISLPNLKIFQVSGLGMVSGGTIIPHTLTNNGNLSSSDRQVQRVTLLFNSGSVTRQHFRLDIFFSDLLDIDWFFLSGVRFCNRSPQSLPSGTVTPQAASAMVTTTLQDLSSQLTCTVSSSGSFEWQWMREGSPSPLQGDKYSVATALGTRESVLTISQLESNDSGMYLCQVKRVGGSAASQNITLTVSDSSTSMPVDTTSPDTSDSTLSTATTTAPPGPAANNNTTVTAVVVVLVLFFIAALIATIIIIIVLYMRWRRRTHLYDDPVDLRKPNGKPTLEHSGKRLTKEDINWRLSSHKKSTPSPPPDQVYAMVDKKPKKEAVPPIPPQLFATSDIDASLRGSISPSGSPKLKKLTKKTKYELSTNPIYESSDKGLNVDPENPDALYAIPDKNVKKSRAVNEPIYNEPLDPTLFRQVNEPIYNEPLDPNLFRQADEGLSQNELHPYGPIYAEPERFSKNDAPLEITPENVEEVKVLGLGQFGEVALATTVGLSLKDLKLSADDNDRGVRIEVAVKKLKPNAEKEVFINFQKEIKFMARLQDDNIVRLLAVCNGETPFIVMEYMENGDLNQFLKKHSIATSESSITANQLPVSMLVYMTVQISSGMRYLASLNHVHRDMATRNCLIGRDFVVKIADFGMSRSLYESSYYRVRGRAMLPIRWMATESFYGRFSEKTDVWAFGITMWEIFVLCKRQPFEQLNDQAMIQDAIQATGRQLPSKPDDCPESVYMVMLRCCQYAPEDRATFEEIFRSLAAIHRAM